MTIVRCTSVNRVEAAQTFLCTGWRGRCPWPASIARMVRKDTAMHLVVLLSACAWESTGHSVVRGHSAVHVHKLLTVLQNLLRSLEVTHWGAF